MITNEDWFDEPIKQTRKEQKKEKYQTVINIDLGTSLDISLDIISKNLKKISPEIKLKEEINVEVFSRKKR